MYDIDRRSIDKHWNPLIKNTSIETRKNAVAIFRLFRRWSLRPSHSLTRSAPGFDPGNFKIFPRTGMRLVGESQPQSIVFVPNISGLNPRSLRSAFL